MIMRNRVGYAALAVLLCVAAGCSQKSDSDKGTAGSAGSAGSGTAGGGGSAGSGTAGGAGDAGFLFAGNGV